MSTRGRMQGRGRGQRELQGGGPVDCPVGAGLVRGEGGGGGPVGTGLRRGGSADAGGGEIVRAGGGAIDTSREGAPSRQEARHSRVGRRGEQVAADYLRQRGYRLLDRNWRSPDSDVPGELDLVLRHRGTLVICEVKSRTGTHLAHPAEAVTPAKAARLRRLAAVWLRESSRRRRPALGRSDFVEEFPRLGRFGRLTRLARFARVARFAALAGVPATPVGSKAGRVRARAEVAIRTSAACPPSARGRVPRPIRIDVVAVRLAPREPFPVLAIDHLIGVA